MGLAVVGLIRTIPEQERAIKRGKNKLIGKQISVSAFLAPSCTPDPEDVSARPLNVGKGKGINPLLFATGVPTGNLLAWI